MAFAIESFKELMAIIQTRALAFLPLNLVESRYT